MKNNRADRENDKFKAVGPNELTAIRVSLDEAIEYAESFDGNFDDNDERVIASGATQTVYTNEFLDKCIIKNIYLSGENIATFYVKKNGFLVLTSRTNWTKLNESINLNLVMNINDVLSIEAFNNRPTSAKFEAYISGKR